MYYYKYNNNIFFSLKELNAPFMPIVESEASSSKEIIYAVNSQRPEVARRSFALTSPQQIFMDKEDLRILKKDENYNSDFKNIPEWLQQKIDSRQVTSININYPHWEDILNNSLPFQSKLGQKSWKINVIGLGDVGGTLVTGLRLLGSDYVSTVGIYDRDANRIKRWELEANQVTDPFNQVHPKVIPLAENQFFDCDIFVFCVSIGVPEVGKEPEDVRLAQFEGNSRILSFYAREARKQNFKGIFVVVSDPVDLLCKVAFNESNKNDSGEYDFKGLSSDQIRGYGLGVMHSRACYFAGLSENTVHYLKEGRAFGPHGEGVVIADSIENYNEELTDYLSEKTKLANLEVRTFGFKPYIAPALSSGTLSLLAAIKGEYHYSATFIGGVFMGSRNRLLPSGVELETYNLPDNLFRRLNKTYDLLKGLYY